MNKVFFVIVLLLFISSCNKEKRSLKNLNGNWEITSYEEIIFDGTTNKFDLIAGEAKFETSKNSVEGTAAISWKATSESDSVEYSFSGIFLQEKLDELFLMSVSDSVNCKISRQLKKDMTLEMVVMPNRKSRIHLRKK